MYIKIQKVIYFTAYSFSSLLHHMDVRNSKPGRLSWARNNKMMPQDFSQSFVDLVTFMTRVLASFMTSKLFLTLMNTPLSLRRPLSYCIKLETLQKPPGILEFKIHGVLLLWWNHCACLVLFFSEWRWGGCAIIVCEAHHSLRLQHDYVVITFWYTIYRIESNFEAD